MPKIRIYLKSGSQVELNVEAFQVKRDRNDDKIIEWSATWREYPKILSLPPSNIEAVIQLSDD